eukprot:m.219378 g.219378  ORF g.219378 m.219378 type:complete len:483 (-) comp17232_c0_seq2:2468-3916(-)
MSKAVLSRQLAVLLARLDFGDVVADVYDTLFKQPCNFRRLRYLCQPQSAPELKNSLVVLLQHRLVYQTSEDHPVFHPNLQVALLRYRIPAFCRIVNRLHGELAERIFEQLFLHGLMRMSRLLSTLETLLGEDVDRATLVKLFRKLVEKRLICRHNTDKDKQHRLPEECLQLGKTTASTTANTNSAQDTGIYFRVNYATLLRHLKFDWAEQFLKAKISAPAAAIARVLMDSSIYTDPDSSGVVRTPALTPDQVAAGLQFPIESSDVVEWLQVLLEDSCGIVQSAGMELYQYSASATEQLAQLRAVERTIEERHGNKALRVFNVVKEQKYVEQDQLCGMAMVANFKSTRLTLNELWRDDFLSVQELPRTADRAPARSQFLWTVNLEKTILRVVDDCHHFLLNALQRVHSEQETHQKLLSQQDWLLDEPVPGSEDAEFEDEKTKLDRRKLKKLLAGLQKLEQEALMLDRFVMQVRDFDEKLHNEL